MKRKDIWLIGAVFLTALALFAASGLLMNKPAPDAGGGYLKISVDGKARPLVPLSSDADIVVEQPNGARNVVRIESGGVQMAQSNCKNHDCMRQGTVTLLNRNARVLQGSIICLPNRVSLEVLLADEIQGVLP